VTTLQIASSLQRMAHASTAIKLTVVLASGRKISMDRNQVLLMSAADLVHYVGTVK